MPAVIDKINKYIAKHRDRLLKHPNPLANKPGMKQRNQLKQGKMLNAVQSTDLRTRVSSVLNSDKVNFEF